MSKNIGELIDEIKELTETESLITTDKEKPFFGEISILYQAGKPACIKRIETIKT